jgi:tetratricopeptide (TPR) repeat protein
MRRFYFASFLTLCLALPTVAQDKPVTDAPVNPPAGGPAAKDQTPKPQPPKSRAERLNDLFARLAKAQDAAEANGIGSQIERIWRQSGSDTTDLLLERADKAIADKKFDLGLDLLDSILALKPDWAEAWNRRATLHFLREDYDGSMRDIARVLKLEPRHYGALAGMAMIHANMDNMKAAVKAGRQALQINPQMEELKQLVERHARDTEGSNI